MTTKQDALVFSQTNFGYWEFDRDQWSSFWTDAEIRLTPLEMETLVSTSSPMAAAEAINILLPLCRLLNLHSTATRALSQIKTGFLGRQSIRSPYIVGVTGSVAVGKSSFAKMLSVLLSYLPSAPKVQVVATDSFLLPLAKLVENNLLHRKGFPESYDESLLSDFLHSVRGGQPIQIPVYSHLSYDILPDQVQRINAPDIIVLEGVNVLRGEKEVGLNVADFLDFSIYIDAPLEVVKKWYVERFIYLKRTAFQLPGSYFSKFRDLTDRDALSIASERWDKINLQNLVENILPTRDRASLIVNKSPDHSIHRLLLRAI